VAKRSYIASGGAPAAGWRLLLPGCSSPSGGGSRSRPEAAPDWFSRDLASLQRLLRVVQLRRDLSLPDNRGSPGWPFDAWHLLRRPLLLVQEGDADGVDLSGLAAAFTYEYDDDEPRSPWRFVVYVDARGSGEQRDALAAILLGRLGGDDVLGLPWVQKPSELVEIRARPIEIRRRPPGHELRIGSTVELSATRPVATDERVTCIVPGHHIPGRELYADRLTVRDEPFEWELTGNCAFVSTFSYRSG
jgi:hypothetical protein